MSRILVTGANGFLGQRIAEVLLRNSNETRLCGRGPVSVVGAEDYVSFDLCGSLPENLFDGISTVIHVAGLAHCFGPRDPSDFHKVNVDAAVRLAEEARNSAVRHFVYVSSVAVYGPDETQSIPRDEASALHPVTPYGESKKLAEERLTETLADSSTRLTIFRPTTIYGIGEPGNIGRLIRFIDRLPFWWPIGSGRNDKSLIHVDDAAELIVAASLSSDDFDSPRVFNVSDVPRPMSEITNTVCEATGTFRLPFHFPTAFLKKIGGTRVRRILEKWESSDAYDGTHLTDSVGQHRFRSLDTGIQEQYRSMRRCGASGHGSWKKRLFDILATVALLLVFAIPMLAIGLIVRMTSRGPALYSSQRMGANGKLFPMLKFRSMRIDTPQVATHLLADSNSFITPIGHILRKTSLDELPQLLNVLTGSMSLVGPRPALFNQEDLISLRQSRGVSWLRPGITGWAQICGRDEVSIPEKVELDVEYADRRSFWFDIQILAKTGIKVIARDNIAQADTDTRLNAVTVRHGQHDLLLIDSHFATVGGLFADQFTHSEIGSESNGSLKVVGIRDWSRITAETLEQQSGSKRTVIAAREQDIKSISQSALENQVFVQLPVEVPQSFDKLRRLSDQLCFDVSNFLVTATESSQHP